LSFVAATVREEIGFALANRGVAAVIVQSRVTELADRLDIEHLLDRGIHELSAGEACLVAIAAALVEHPVLLLVDEPLADLDDAARDRVVGALDRLAHEAGVCVVVAEHAITAWRDVPDVRVALDAGTARVVSRQVVAPEPPALLPPVGEQVAMIEALSVSYADRAAVEAATFTLAAGEIVALRGPNGAGKSSLLHAIARPTGAGVVTVDGRDAASLRRTERRRRVALVPEEFDDLLFATTVGEECRRADSRAARGATAETFVRLIGYESVPATRGLLARHPRDLSSGERLCLVIAIQLSARPRVLLVDEPTRGLDARARALVGAALVGAAAGGAAVVFATHDRDFAARYASRTLTMAHGRLSTAVEVAP